MSEREWNHGPIQACTLDEILDTNKPLDEVLAAWPVFYSIRADLWPKLVEFLGLEYDPETQRPFHINYKGRELWRFRPHFAHADHEVIAWELPAVLSGDEEPPSYFDLTRLSTREPRTGDIESE